MRLDKFLWTVRLYKTRSLADKECQSGHVKLNDNTCKSSKEVQQNDIVAIRVTPVWRTFKVLGIPKSRVGARLVPQYLVETTPEPDLELLSDIQAHNRQNKILGIKGRPTKKQRRDLDKFK